MSPTAAEIETIVRRVLSTLSATAAPSGLLEGEGALKLSIADRVVSLQSIRDKLANQQVVEIGRMAVITPAAKDFCKERKVTIVRVGSETIPDVAITKVNSASPEAPIKPSKPQRLFVAGTASWMPAVAKQLCSNQSKVEIKQEDDASVMRSISDGLRAGHQAGLAIVASPHAACWQAARDDRLRPAVVSNWIDLADVLREVPVNVLILSSKNWNVPATCNVARRFFEHLRTNS